MYNYLLDLTSYCMNIYENLLFKQEAQGFYFDQFVLLYNQMEYITSFDRESAFNLTGKYLIKIPGSNVSFKDFVNLLVYSNLLTVSLFEPSEIVFDFANDINKFSSLDVKLPYYHIKNSVMDRGMEMTIFVEEQGIHNLKFMDRCLYLNFVDLFIQTYVKNFFASNTLFVDPLSFVKRAISYNLQSINYSIYLFKLLEKGIFFNDNFFFNDLFFVLPFIYYFFLLFAIFTFILFINKYKNQVNIVNLVSNFSIIFIIFSLFLYSNILLYFNNFNSILLFNSLFNLDLINLNAIIFILFIFIFFIYIYSDYFKNEKFLNFEYLIISLIALFGLFCLICSFDFLSLYLSIELQTLCLYIMASYKYFSNFSTEAGLKYFVLGSLSSGFLLFGISIIYGIIGSTNFYDIFLFLKGMNTTNNLSFEFFSLLNKNIEYLDFEVLINLYFLKVSIFFCFLFIMFSFFFKLGLSPFHIWLPDVYQGSPSISTAFFALLPKIGFFIIFIKFVWYCVSIIYLNMYYLDFNSFLHIKNYLIFKENIAKVNLVSYDHFFKSMEIIVGSLNLQKHMVPVNFSHIFSILNGINIKNLDFNFFFLFCSILSLIIGTFSALNQTKIKRFIAFSAIAHVGFIFINIITFNLLSLNVILFYLIIYTIINLNFFAIFLSIRDSFSNNKLFDILDFSNIYKTNKILVYLFIFNMFSMAGIPPFSGFFMKMYVFYNLLDESFLVLFFLIIISCFSAFYYIRLVNISLFNINKNNKSIKRISKSLAYIIVITSFLNLFYFLFPNFLFNYVFFLVNSLESINFLYNFFYIF